jgi:uncharacterized ion transporter superfamily protein YfcC
MVHPDLETSVQDFPIFEKKKIMLKRIPDSIVIVFFIMILMMVLSWIIPAGSFDRETRFERTVVVAGSYHTVESSPQNPWHVMQAPFTGFTEAARIIGFVFLVGGAFGLVMATGAIDAGLRRLLKWAGQRKRSRLAVCTGLMLLFGLCGFTFGMSEESLVFILITLPMARSMGFDPIVGVAIPFVSSGIGGAAAAYNPFGVGIALQIAELEFPSEVGMRLVACVLLMFVVIGYTLRYAIQLQTGSGVSWEVYDKKTPASIEETPFDRINQSIVALFVLTLVVIPIGAKLWDWDIPQIGAIFLIMGLLTALLKRSPSRQIVDDFVHGARGMVGAAIIIALSRGVLILARDGQIIDTILFALSESVQGLPAWMSIQIMFLVQGAINFFIPSGSGQAAITMPIMVPLADLIGVSRQGSVMAFQLAAGLFDLIIPTSAVTMGVLSLAGIPFSAWFKWMGKLTIWLMLVCMAFLAVLTLLGI